MQNTKNSSITVLGALLFCVLVSSPAVAKFGVSPMLISLETELGKVVQTTINLNNIADPSLIGSLRTISRATSGAGGDWVASLYPSLIPHGKSSNTTVELSIRASHVEIRKLKHKKDSLVARIVISIAPSL